MGSCTDIGRATARAFPEKGACGGGPRPASGAAARDRGGLRHQHVEVIEANITDATALDGAVAAVVRRFGHLDVNFANAGTNEPSGVNAFDDDTWERQRSVNLDAVIRLARRTVPRLRAARGSYR